MLTSGCYSAFSSACPSWHNPRKPQPIRCSPPPLVFRTSPQPHTHPGTSDLRLAVVTPFIDRQHGTERALAELLDRLSREYACEIHLYAERVQDLAVKPSGDTQEPVILSRPKAGE